MHDLMNLKSAMKLAGTVQITMKQIELYVHTSDGVEPKLVKTSEDATVKQLIEAIKATGAIHVEPGEELHLFVEDMEEHIHADKRLCDCEIRHRQHVHCHRCHRVKVSVFYNAEKEKVFPPSAKVKRVLRWAIEAFGLTPADAADKVLVLKENPDVELSEDAHIGSVAKSPECAVDLCLVAPVTVEG